MKLGTFAHSCVLVLALLPALAFGQQGGDQQPAVAMGAGRMVRGTITAVAPDHVTVKTDAGEIFQIAVTPNTQVRKGRDPMKYADVHVGDGVGAMGEVDRPNKTVHAMFMSVVDAEQIKKAKEAMGKSYIAGKVIAIEDLKLTILRADGVTQVIRVDEDTSFKRGGRGMQMMMGDGGLGAAGGERRRGSAEGGGAGQGTNAARDGESITLSDLKVGDPVGGPGALKAGVFVPTELNVGEPGRRGGRRQGEGGSAGANGSSKPGPETN